jgi:hypothetical protein
MASVMPLTAADQKRLERMRRALGVPCVAETAGITAPTVYRALRGAGLQPLVRNAIVDVLNAYQAAQQEQRGG